MRGHTLDTRLTVLLMIGVFMGALDLTILAPALPHIGESFGLTPAAIVLAFSTYAAFYAVSVPLMSKLADVRGYKTVYGGALVLFCAGSVAAALAPSLPVLVLSLVAQGVGGGGLFPVAQAIVGVAVPQHERGKVLGVLLGTFALGGVLGPNLGGFLVQNLSWRWIYWINVPLCLLGLLLLAPLRMPGGRREGRIDWLGAALVAVTFGSFVVGMEGLRHTGQGGAPMVRAGTLFAVAAVGMVLLVLVERRQTEPILDFGLITSGRIGPLLVLSLLIGYALLGSVVFLPFYVQLQFQASSLGSGAVLNAAAVGLGLSSWIAGLYTARTGGRRLVVLGMAAMVAGIALMIGLRDHLGGMLGALALLGAGLGLTQGPLSYMSLALVGEKDQGQVSGLIAITRSMGGAIGITLGGVMLGQAANVLNRYAATAGVGLSAQAWGSSSSLAALRQAPPEVREMIRQTLSEGILYGWYWALAAAGLGLGLSFLLKQPRPASQPVAADRR